MQLSLFDEHHKYPCGNYHICIEELFRAYIDCRNSKRNSLSALNFEIEYEENLLQLKEELENGTYSPKPSIAFIVNKPVKREIFAADFKDRVVHHWLINKLNPYLENHFIADSYSCRIGKGTHFGINRIDEFIKDCSKNYSEDAYILKLDVQGFFMHINRKILYKMLQNFILIQYKGFDKGLVLEVTKKIIFNNAVLNCSIKGNKNDWSDLPRNKSLFHSPPECGLPIGNLTSQIFANIYLHALDIFITQKIRNPYYGRYVDDFIIIHHDREFLKALIPQISNFLSIKLKLNLHPNKIYLQHYSKGVKFLGHIIKPNRIYISNRIKGNFFQAIHKQNRIIHNNRPTKEILIAFLNSMNSYLGLMKHTKSYKLRKRFLLSKLSGSWLNYFYLSKGLSKFVMLVRPFRKSDMLPR